MVLNKILFIAQVNRKSIQLGGLYRKILAQASSLCVFSKEVYILCPNFNEFSLIKVESNSNEVINSFSSNNQHFNACEFWDFATNFVNNSDFDFVYCRFSSNYFFVEFLQLIESHIKRIIEFPTYPYYEELNLAERESNHYLVSKVIKYSDFVFSPSPVDRIFNMDVHHFTNDIFEKPSELQIKNYNKKKIRFLVIANIQIWHGFDRILKGLHSYLAKNSTNITIDLYGHGDELDNVMYLTNKLSLDEKVRFHKFTNFDFFKRNVNKWDFGISSLGLHRIKINDASPLKSRDYLSIGLPFVTTFNDKNFDNYDFAFQVSSDESPLDFEEILKYFRSISPTKMANDSIKYFKENKPWQKFIDNFRPIIEK